MPRFGNAAGCCALVAAASALASPPYVPTFLPAPVANGFRNDSLRSWGGGVLLVDGTYHLFASAFVNGCGLDTWGSNSIAIHASAASPLGPFTFVERALPFYHHNVQPVRAPDGTFLIFSIGMVPDPVPTKCHGATGEEAQLLHTPPPPPLEHGFESTECWSAPTVHGPWAPVPGGAPNGRNLFNSTNPAPAFAPSGNGTILVMGHDGSNVMTIAVAPSWRGPYSAPVAVFPTLQGGYRGEDPFLWWDAAIVNDEGGVGAWRALYHMYNISDTRHQVRVGGYAQSTGPNALGSWRVQDNAAPAYTTAVTYEGAPGGAPTVAVMSRRERPKLYLSPATGAPEVLYTGVCPAGDGNACFTLAVPIAPPQPLAAAPPPPPPLVAAPLPQPPVATAPQPPVAAAPPTAFPPLALTVLPQAWADTYGAKCLDGSPPAHYALLQDPLRWVVFIEGGGWCFTPASCAGRAAGGGGSSHGMGPSMVVGGLLSPDPAINPRFANYSLVFLHYCDGASHSSNAVAPVPTTAADVAAAAAAADVPGGAEELFTSGGLFASGGSGAVPAQVWHRGRPNLDAQVQYLLQQRGMSAATEVILTGGSAGGTSVFLGADHVAAQLPKATRFVAAPDAGFFIDAPVWSVSTIHAFRNEFIGADVFWNSTASGGVNRACLAAYAATPWACFFPENAARFIATPFHSMMAAYDLASLSMIYDLPCLPPKCAPAQLAALLAWRALYLAALEPAVASYPGNGAFVDSCLVHEQNVAYCSGQSVPNCRGWLVYNVTAPGFPAQLTPQAGFSLWYDALHAQWHAVAAARDAWGARVAASLPHGAAAYPQRTRAEARALQQQQVVVIDPLVWPHNPSCPWGSTPGAP